MLDYSSVSMAVMMLPQSFVQAASETELKRLSHLQYWLLIFPYDYLVKKKKSI